MAAGKEPNVKNLFGNLPDESAVPANYEELFEWAKLFKATTWEEMKQLATENDYIAETVVTYHEMSTDEKIREQCEARERYDHDKASYIGTGIRLGRSEGEKIGFENGLRGSLISLVQDGLLDKAEAARRSGLTLAQFEELLNQADE